MENLIAVLIAVLVFALIMGGMALGLIMRNKPIKGSCGGMSAMGMDTACDICGGDTSKCDGEEGQSQVPGRRGGPVKGTAGVDFKEA